MSSISRANRNLRYISDEDSNTIQSLNLHILGLCVTDESRERLREMKEADKREKKAHKEKKAEHRRSNSTGFCRKFDGLGKEEEEPKVEQSVKSISGGTKNGKNSATKEEKRRAREKRKEEKKKLEEDPFVDCSDEVRLISPTPTDRLRTMGLI